MPEFILNPFGVVIAFSTETFTFGRECFWTGRLAFAAVELAVVFSLSACILVIILESACSCPSSDPSLADFCEVFVG